VSVEALDAIRKSVVVAAPVERAWELFVERIGSWWPLATHSIGGEQTQTAIATPDRIFERWQDGSERVWGHVLAWEPPHRFVFTWEIGEDCGNEVEVRFLAEGDGTRVDLEHRGWDSGTTPESWRGYDTGWGSVLGRFEEAAA
jgi:uncharacterized protein YndB with AHSA1/START domain